MCRRGKRGSIVVSLRPKSQASKTRSIMGDGGSVFCMQQTERERLDSRLRAAGLGLVSLLAHLGSGLNLRCLQNPLS